MSIPEDHRRLLARLDYQPDCDSALFEDSEWILIERYGAWMEALATGMIKPFTNAQIRFLAVANDQVEPQTDFEIVWKKLARVLKQSEFGDVHREEGLEVGRICGRCGQAISPDRLEVFPDATFCKRCQENAEHEQTDSDAKDLYCPRCANRGLKSKLVYRQARDPEIRGHFLGCSNFPDCRYTEN